MLTLDFIVAWGYRQQWKAIRLTEWKKSISFTINGKFHSLQNITELLEYINGLCFQFICSYAINSLDIWSILYVVRYFWNLPSKTIVCTIAKCQQFYMYMVFINLTFDLKSRQYWRYFLKDAKHATNRIIRFIHGTSSAYEIWWRHLASCTFQPLWKSWVLSIH